MSPLPVNNALEDKIAYPEILESSSYPPEGLTRSPLLNKPLHVLPYLLVLAILFVYQAGLETLKCKSSNCTVSVLCSFTTLFLLRGRIIPMWSEDSLSCDDYTALYVPFCFGF